MIAIHCNCDVVNIAAETNLKETRPEMYEKLMATSKTDNLMQKFAVMNESHPFSAEQVNEILKWERSPEYEVAKGFMFGTSDICPHCHKPVMKGWTFAATEGKERCSKDSQRP